MHIMVRDILISANDRVTQTECGMYQFNGKVIDQDGEEGELIREAENNLAGIINEFAGGQHENTMILTGAGASIIDIETCLDCGQQLYYSGKTVTQLTQEIDVFLKENQHTLTLEDLAKKVKYIKEDAVYNVKEINIEDLLSKAESAKEYIDTDPKFDKTIEKTELRI